jgi:hypothetical protein
MALHLEASQPAYVPRDPRQTILYQVVAEHLETFLATLAADPTAKGLPAYVVEEFYAYRLCRGTVRVKSRDFSKSTADSNGRRPAGLPSDSHRLPPCGRTFETQVPNSRSSSSILPHA